ncbi:MAG: ATP-binding protein [Pseudomonadota bacterium]
MDRFINWYERFLRIDEAKDTGVILRARALYCFGWLFITLQLTNLASLNYSYGGWATPHWQSIGAIFVVFCITHLLRYYKNFTVYALLVTLLYISFNTMTASVEYTGINTSLLPFTVIVPMVCGFIAGPRMALASGALLVVFIISLYNLTIAAPWAQAHTDIYSQRALQAGFAVVMVSFVAATFSKNTYQAFELLEENIRRARRAEAAKTAFLASMSHELRTPLNGVLGLTEAMQRTSLNEEQEKLMGTIDRSGRTLLAVLNDILDLSKIEAQKLRINRALFSPKELAQDLSEMWQEAAAAKGVSLEVNLASELPPMILADDLRIRQIASNLLSNAIKFTEEGEVTLSMRTDPLGRNAAIYSIAITDTGAGISDAAKERIFRPFEQAEQGITRRYGGTGLGLSICLKLAHLMGGDIELNTQEGAGSTFTLRIPVSFESQREDNSSYEPTKTPVDLSVLVGKRVLLVEDNLVNQMVAAQFLKAMQIDHEVANNGQEGLDHLAMQPFDLVLMDKHMPVMDGIEAMAAIRQMQGGIAHIPIIACTADAMTGEAENLLSLGFDDFISKPINSTELGEKLARALQKRAVAIAA